MRTMAERGERFHVSVAAMGPFLIAISASSDHQQVSGTHILEARAADADLEGLWWPAPDSGLIRILGWRVHGHSNMRSTGWTDDKL
jgi:hypothetical protein